MGQKGTGRRLSDQERMEIIAKLEGDKPRASAAECARQYGVSSAAITKLMKMKDKIKQRFKENNAFSQQRKRGGTERHAAFEDELYQWISTQQQQYMYQQEHLQIEMQHQKVETLQSQQEEALDTATEASAEATGDMSSPMIAEASNPYAPSGQLIQPLTSAKVQEKAQELLKAHNLGAFRASKGWYYRFCRRYGLSRTSLSADDGEDDEDDLGHSGSDSEGSTGDCGLDIRQVGRKRKDGSSARDGKRSRSQKGWAGVHALQDTLARAALALDHPEAREYLGEDAASEMLRSIQQSIGVVQCIRLKKSVMEATSTSVTEAGTLVKTEDESSALPPASPATQPTEAALSSPPEPAPAPASAPLTDVIV